MGPGTEPSRTTGASLDADLARAERSGMRDLGAVLDDLLSAEMPSAAEEFLWPLFVHDGKTVLYANRACARWLTCHSDNALDGAPLSALTSADDYSSLLAAVGASNAGTPAAAHVQRFVTQEGAALIGRVQSQKAPFRESDATFTLVEPGSTADRSLDLLRLLEEAVDHLADIVFITEANAIDGIGRRIVFVNRAFSQSSGFQPSEVLGKTPNVTVGPETDRATLSRIELGLRQQRPVREELLKYGKDGAGYWVELDIIPVFDELGEHTHWVSVQRDITERKRLQERLVESAKLASAGMLSASLASEINNPLASVASSLEWLAEQLPALIAKLGQLAPELEREAAQLVEAFNDARTGAQRMAKATSYLRLMSGETNGSRQSIVVGELLDAAVAEAARQLQVRGRLERDYQPGVIVLADPNRLGHALRLAFTNAVLALLPEREPDNCITLRVFEDATAVHVRFEDTGSGITQDMVGKLHAPFSARRPPGIGDALGLFVADRLIAELDGQLELMPRVGGGTAVEIRLPTQAPAAPGAVAPPAALR